MDPATLESGVSACIVVAGYEHCRRSFVWKQARLGTAIFINLGQLLP